MLEYDKFKLNDQVETTVGFGRIIGLDNYKSWILILMSKNTVKSNIGITVDKFINNDFINDHKYRYTLERDLSKAELLQHDVVFIRYDRIYSLV